MLAACNKTEIIPIGDAQEIAFTAVNKVATKAPVNGTTFLTTDDMDVVAYLASGNGATPGTFFTETRFVNSGTTWTGKRYWPLSDATINFLAVTNMGGNVNGHVENVFDVTTPASKVVSTLTSNHEAAQTDLMFAACQGTHIQGTEYSSVPMVFKHALSWINFEVKTGNGNTDADPKITINSITLNQVPVNGTLTVTNNNYATTGTECTTENLGASWGYTDLVNVKLVENGIVNDDFKNDLPLTGTSTTFGTNGILVIPSVQTSFTINYTITQPDGTPNTFDYEYELSGNWEMAKKYVYKISMTLSEIEISPEIDDWGTAVTTDVDIKK